jgi:hypothetical protein
MHALDGVLDLPYTLYRNLGSILLPNVFHDPLWFHSKDEF